VAHHPKGSQDLARHQPHHYQSTPEEEEAADKLLEELAHKVAKDKGITVAAARKELRHWV
jgi:hypothetical protein